MAKTNYKKVYCTFFGYRMTNDEWIPSEVSNTRAIDIHHIVPKQMGGKLTFLRDGKEFGIDSIENLIALTREEHNDAHNGNLSQDKLWDIHQKKIQAHLRISKSIINGK